MKVWGEKPRLLVPLAARSAFIAAPSSSVLWYTLFNLQNTLPSCGLDVLHSTLETYWLKHHFLEKYPTFPVPYAQVGGALTLPDPCLLSPLHVAWSFAGKRFQVNVS